MKIHRSLFIICIVTLFVNFSCDIKESNTYVMREVPERSFSDFIAKIDKFPYEASGVKKERIITNYQNLSRGMTPNEVLSLLGEPDFITETYNKTKGNRLLESLWTYYLHRHEAKFANDLYDQSITVYFNKDGKLYRVLPQNVRGLTEKRFSTF